jgi:hypothetical protein
MKHSISQDINLLIYELMGHMLYNDSQQIDDTQTRLVQYCIDYEVPSAYLKKQLIKQFTLAKAADIASPLVTIERAIDLLSHEKYSTH